MSFAEPIWAGGHHAAKTEADCVNALHHRVGATLKVWASTPPGTGIFHMVKIIVGIDIAKNVFQVHAADGTGATAYTKKLSRRQVLPFFAKHAAALIGMEACATSHY